MVFNKSDSMYLFKCKTKDREEDIYFKKTLSI